MRIPVTLVLVGLCLGPFARAAEPELTKLHVLMVFDSNAKDLTQSVRVDEKRMDRLWVETIPAARRSVKTLKGDKATKKDVLAYYDALKVKPDEGLVFYFAGHGARDDQTKKHFFDLKQGGPLVRDDLLQAMQAKGAGLVLVLTDCCSSPQSLKETMTADRGVVLRAEQVHETVRCLLFQARGTVDLTAATDNSSWSDNAGGGLFTRSVDRLLRQPIKVLDGNKDGVVTWREFYPQLRDETRSLFGAWRKEMTSRGEKIDDRHQEPFAFALGRLGVVGVENASADVLEYTYRWAGEEAWGEVKLAAGEKRTHTRMVSQANGSPPGLEVRFKGSAKVQTLKATDWTSNDEPAGAPPRYRIKPR